MVYIKKRLLQLDYPFNTTWLNSAINAYGILRLGQQQYPNLRRSQGWHWQESDSRDASSQGAEARLVLSVELSEIQRDFTEFIWTPTFKKLCYLK